MFNFIKSLWNIIKSLWSSKSNKNNDYLNLGKNMRYKYLAVYKLNGIIPPTNKEEKVLVEYPKINAKAFLTYDLSTHLTELDEASGIGNLMLNMVVGFLNEGTFEERLTQELKDIKERRKKDIGEGTFVIFEAKGDVESFNPRKEGETPNFIIAFDGIEKQPIKSKYQVYINGLLASFSLGSDHVYGVKKVTDGVVFVNEKGKSVYSYTFGGSAKGSVSSKLTEDSIIFVQNNAMTLGEHEKLITPSRLLSRSLDENSDDLQSFLSAWSGIEIFINKNFKEFKKIALLNSKKEHTLFAPEKFQTSLENIVKNRIGLIDRFSVILFELAPASYDDDIEYFGKIKDVRDKFMHGQDIAVSSLPTEDVRKLLRKYLKLYVQRIK